MHSILFFVLPPCVLAYYFGYQMTSDWNSHAVRTTGMVIYNYVVETTCQKECNCGEGCDSCPYTCYFGKYVVNYTTIEDKNRTYTAKIIHDHYYGDYAYAVEQMNKMYPAGKYVTIYYNSRNPSDAKVVLENAMIPFIFAFVILGFGTLILLIWIAIEVYIEYRR